MSNTKAEFLPLPDITAYELAVMVQNGAGEWATRGVIFHHGEWDALPANIKRHFKLSGNPEVEA